MNDSSELDYLTLDDLLVVANRIIASGAIVRDVGLLESALARPRATAFGVDAYPDLDQKAAALLQSLVANHALVDGNKRLGWIACLLFYDLNEIRFLVPTRQAVDMVLSIADGSLSDVDAIAKHLAVWRAAR